MSLILSRGELSFTSEHHSVPSAERLSSERLEIGTLLKHKSPERKHLTFRHNHRLLGRTHKNTRIHTNKGNNYITLKVATFSKIWAGAERQCDISEVCAVAWQPWQLNQKAVNLTESVLYSSSPWKQSQLAGAKIIFNLLKMHLFLVGHHRNVCLGECASTCDRVDV